MLKLSHYIDNNLQNLPKFDVRSKITLNASESGKSWRDIYWKVKGEPETNPTDTIGFKRMALGTAAEGLIIQWLRDMSYKGVNVLKTQARLGGSNPEWAGFSDIITMEPNPVDNKYHCVVNEIKLRFGYGATKLLEELDPSTDYMLQLGLYLKDLYDKKGKVYPGRLFYMLIPEQDQKTLLGAFLEFWARYEPETGDVVFYDCYASPGVVLQTKFQEKRVSVKKLLDKWKVLYECLIKDELPPQDYMYKYPLTPEFLAACSDKDIKSAAQGYKILGDWQISYSNYKKKHLELQGTGEGYTPDETELLVREYKRRKPKQRSF